METPPVLDEILVPVASLIFALLVLVIVILSFRGFRAFRRELESRKNYELSRRILRRLRSLRDEIDQPQPLGRRLPWRGVAEAYSHLQEALLESQLVWGDRLDESAIELSRLLEELRLSSTDSRVDSFTHRLDVLIARFEALLRPYLRD